jgi:anti-anti-sigma factor
MSGTAELPHEHPPAAVVVLPAEIDLASAPAVTETLIFAVSTRPGVVVADLTGTTFCDCAAVRGLCHATEYAAARGTDLRLVIPAGLVRRVLDLTGRDRELHLYPAITSALATPRAGDATSPVLAFRKMILSLGLGQAVPDGRKMVELRS